MMTQSGKEPWTLSAQVKVRGKGGLPGWAAPALVANGPASNYLYGGFTRASLYQAVKETIYHRPGV